MFPNANLQYERGKVCAVSTPYVERKTILCINQGGEPNILKDSIFEYEGIFIPKQKKIVVRNLDLSMVLF